MSRRSEKLRSRPERAKSIDKGKVKFLKKGESYIKHIDATKIRECKGLFSLTSDFSLSTKVDYIMICITAPLNNREPNLEYAFHTTRTITRYLRKGQLIALYFATSSGTIDKDMRATLEERGMKGGRDFHLVFSLEREDPNNRGFSTATIPKVVGGYTPRWLSGAKALYDSVVVKTVHVSSTNNDGFIEQHAKCIVDTRNAYRNIGSTAGKSTGRNRICQGNACDGVRGHSGYENTASH